jgi:ABC-type branched-subunit amino acid transport system substrate-binding protein
MNKKLMLILMIPMLLLSAIAAIAFNINVSAASTVNIGILFPKYLTQGGGGFNGKGGTYDGAQLAANEINAAGGIQVGASKELISLDFQDEGAYDPGTGGYNTVTTDTSMAEMLGKDQFIIGGFRTETTTEALTDLATYNTGATSPVPFFICGAATGSLINTTGVGKWVFRVTPVNDTQLFYTTANYLKQYLNPRLASMYCNSTYPTANPGKFRYAVIAEGLTWTQTMSYLLTAPAGSPGTPGYNYFLGPNVTTNGVPGSPFPGENFVPAATTYDFTTLVASLKAADVHLIIDIFTLPEVNDLLSAVKAAGMQTMIVGIDVPGQQQSHWHDTGGSTTVAGSANYEVELCWSGTGTPIVPGSGAFWTNFLTFTGGYWPMYTAQGAYDGIYGIKAAIETAGTTDTSDPALLAAIQNTNRTGLTGQFQYAINDVEATDNGINWTKYGTNSYGWSRSEVVQWMQNTTAPSAPYPNEGSQMNVVSPINLVGSLAALPYARKTQIPPTMYPLAPYDINIDGKVSLSDLVLLAKSYNTKPGDALWNPDADLNSDGKISLTDLVSLANHYGQSSPQWPLP